MHRTVVQVVAGAAVVVALAAGCGSGDSNDSAGTSGGASASNGSGAPGAGAGASGGADASTGASSGAGASGGASESGGAGANDGAGGGEAATKVSSAIEQATKAAPITFTSQSAELSDSAKQTVKAIADAMQGNDVKLKVSTSAGYTDAAKAKKLSEQRAQAIVAAFGEYGVGSDRITTEATGNEKAQGDQALQTQIAVA